MQFLFVKFRGLLRQLEYFLSITRNIYYCHISKVKFFHVAELPKWVIYDIARRIVTNLTAVRCTITFSPLFLRKCVIHFGTEGVFFNNFRKGLIHSSCQVIVTWPHIEPKRLDIALLERSKKVVAAWVTASRATKVGLEQLGINSSYIWLIPLGVDQRIFRPRNKATVRALLFPDLDFSTFDFVIGSFQKDDLGWAGIGQPKLEKGPDIFCDVVNILAKNYKILVLLTGPTRTYVQNHLTDDVTVAWRALKRPDEVALYFSAIDVYLVTARYEGGPEAVPQAVAAQCKIISTGVGMAPDWLPESDVVDVMDRSVIAERLVHLLGTDDYPLRNELRENSHALRHDVMGRSFENLYLMTSELLECHEP